MGRMRWIVYLWPGLPQLARQGSWSALVVAIGAAALLNVALLGTFVWTELLAPGWRILNWFLLLAAWSGAAVFSVWLHRREESWMRAEAQQDIFREALDHYLQGNWFESEQALGRLLRKNRRDVEARLMLATLMRHRRRLDEAARQLDVLVRLEGAQKWELEIRREAELLAAMRGEARDDNRERQEVRETETVEQPDQAIGTESEDEPRRDEAPAEETAERKALSAERMHAA